MNQELKGDPDVSDKLVGCCCNHTHTPDCPWEAMMLRETEPKTLEEVVLW